MPRSKKTNTKPKSKTEKTLPYDEIPGYIKVPIPKLNKSIESLEKTKGIFSAEELCNLARSYALASVKLCNDNEIKRGKKHASISIELYFKLHDNEYPLHPDELGFIKLAADIIDPELWERFIKRYKTENKKK
jgi:hypothetical protein